MAARALTSDPDTTAERPNRQLEACPGSQGGLQRADALRRCVSLTADREEVLRGENKASKIGLFNIT